MVISSLLLTILACLSKKLSSQFLSTSIFLSGSWAGVFALQALFAGDMYSSPMAGAIIVCLCSAYLVGELVAGPKTKEALKCARTTVSTVSKANLGYVILLISGMALTGSYRYMSALGFFDSGDLSSALLKAGMVREQLMQDAIVVSAFDKIGFLFAYVGVVLAIYYWYFFGWRWWLLLSSVSVVILGISQGGGRAGVLVVVLQWTLAVWLKYKRTDNIRHILFILGLAVISFAIFIGGQLFREGFQSTSASDTMRVANSLRGYFFGGLSAFSYFIDNRFDPFSFYGGRYSFSSLFAFLGIFPQAPGIYDEYVPISNAGEVSNVYTAFRSFIDDFSIIGAVISYFLSGIVGGMISKKYSEGSTSALAILVPFSSWLIFSPIASLTYFNSFLLSLIAPAFILKLLTPRKKEGT